MAESWTNPLWLGMAVILLVLLLALIFSMVQRGRRRPSIMDR